MKETELKMNRTGGELAPKMTEAMVSASQRLEIEPNPDADMDEMASVRQDYIKGGALIGTMPELMDQARKGNRKGNVGAMERQSLFLDKLGERLAFERTGVRLYDALIAKCEVTPDSIPIDRLLEIRSDEAKHFDLLRRTIEDLGGDPTVQTPCADVSGVMSSGFMQVLTDPRTTVPQCLETILAAELVDENAWELLIELASAMEMQDVVESFTDALENEEEHLAQVQEWYEQKILQQRSLQ